MFFLVALKLEIQLPFLHNEILDIHSASVKISNIFIDTSDGSNLLAQFDITSMDHFTKRFKLTITECALLDQLNISHSMLLPPNKSTVVNLTVPLPFYAEHQNENCEGDLNVILMIAMPLIDYTLTINELRKLCVTSKNVLATTKKVFPSFSI